MLEVESQVCGGGVGLEDGSKAAGGARAAQAQRVPPAAGGEGKLEPLIFDYDAGTVGKWSRKPTKAEGARWREAYPGIDVVREFHAATRWLEAHRTQRKKRFDQFLLRWFSKAQAAVDRRM